MAHEYKGTIDLAAGIRPRNNGSWAMVDAKDVQVGDSPVAAEDRLDAVLTGLDALTADLDSRAMKIFQTDSYGSENKFSLSDMPENSVAYCQAIKFADKPTISDDQNGHGVSSNAMIRIINVSVASNSYMKQRIVYLYDSARDELWIGEYQRSRPDLSSEWTVVINWKRTMDQGDRNALDTPVMRRLTSTERSSFVSAIYNEATFPFGRYFTANGEQLKVLFPATKDGEEFFPFANQLGNSSTYYVISYRATNSTVGTIDIFSLGWSTHYHGYVYVGDDSHPIIWKDLSWNTLMYDVLAPEFSTDTVYNEGDYVTRNDKLYRFKVYHAAGTWNSDHVDKVPAVTDIDDIFRLEQITSTSAMNAIQVFLDIPSGRYFRAYKDKILAMYPEFPFELSGVGYVVSARKLIDGVQQYDIISPGGTEHYCGYNQYGTDNIYWNDLSVKSQNVRIQRLEDANPIAFEYYSDFEEVPGYWASNGTLYQKSTDNHTQLIPIRGGVNYYTGFVWGTACMGAWFDKNGDYLAPLIHTATQTFSTESSYNEGAVVKYNGTQYIFTEDHEAGAWNPDQVEEAPDQFTTIPPAYYFHDDWDYSIGRATIYDGKYYKFTEVHSAGPWLGTDVEEIDEAYHPDHAAEDGPDITNNLFPVTRFMTLYRFTAPENAAFVSLNLTRTLNRSKPPLNPTTPANYEIQRYRQYICSKQIFMANGNGNTYSGGNLIIRENDPVYQKTKNLRLCIIGPSTSDINRVKIVGRSGGLESAEATELPSFVNPWPEYQQYYDDIAHSESPTVGTDYAWVAKSGYIAGYQEYLKPWFKEVKVFAYSGTAYPYGRGALNKCSIYTRICGGTETVAGITYNVTAPDLSGYDVFFIQGNGNGLGSAAIEGDYTSTNKEQYCGAIRGILDKILTDNPNAVLYLGIMGYQASDHSEDPARQTNYENRKYMSGEIVKLADEYAAQVLGRATGRAWFNAIPRSFDGSHANNVGNIISGLAHREIMVGI